MLNSYLIIYHSPAIFALTLAFLDIPYFIEYGINDLLLFKSILNSDEKPFLRKNQLQNIPDQSEKCNKTPTKRLNHVRKNMHEELLLISYSLYMQDKPRCERLRKMIKRPLHQNIFFLIPKSEIITNKKSKTKRNDPSKKIKCPGNQNKIFLSPASEAIYHKKSAPKRNNPQKR